MTSSARLSILMPVKGAEPWLVECLESIINQDFGDWELIAVNDHSEDHSKAILSAFANRDQRIKVYENDGTGIINALAKAFRFSNGSYIHRMDADDIMPPQKLTTLMNIAQCSKYSIATGKVRYFGNEPVSEGYLRYEKWINERIDKKDHWKWIYRECVVASSNWITHRDNVEFEDLIYPEDYHMVFKWYEHALDVIGSEQITHLWREHSQRTSRLSDHYNQQSFFRLKIAMFLKFNQVKKRPLLILGKNIKAKLAQEFLSQAKVPSIVLDKSQINKLEMCPGAIVLVAVFPSLSDRNAIENYLFKNGFFQGVDWWWL